MADETTEATPKAKRNKKQASESGTSQLVVASLYQKAKVSHPKHGESFVEEGKHLVKDGVLVERNYVDTFNKNTEGKVYEIDEEATAELVK